MPRLFASHGETAPAGQFKCRFAGEKAPERQDGLGSRGQLPAPGPLRTVLAIFAAHGSSLYESICYRYPLSLLFFGILMIFIALEMFDFQIAHGICPAVAHFHNVTDNPRAAECDWCLTNRADAVLPLPYAIKLCHSPCRVPFLLTPWCCKVGFPSIKMII